MLWCTTSTSSGQGALRTDRISGRVSRSRLSFLSFSVLPILSWHAKSRLQSKYNFWIENFSDLWSGWRSRDDCVGKEELHSLSWSGYLAFLLSQLLQLGNNKQLIRLQPSNQDHYWERGRKDFNWNITRCLRDLGRKFLPLKKQFSLASVDIYHTFSHLFICPSFHIHNVS